MSRTPLLRRTLDLSLAAWGVLVLFRLFVPYFDSPYFDFQYAALAIEKAGLHVAALGICLALAAADAVFGPAERKV